MTLEQFVNFVSLFRVKFGNRPFWLFVAVLLICLLISRLRPKSARPGRASAGMWLAIGAIAVYVAIDIWYLCQEQYYDYAEPTVAAVGWLFNVGRPIYHDFDSAERYSHMYGPMAFMIPGWVMAILGPSITTSKIAGAIAGLISLGAVYRLMRSATGMRTALSLTGLFAVLCLIFRNLSFWIRPDSFQLTAAAVALLAAAIARKSVAAVTLGVATGVLVNLKLTGPLYALPAFAVLMTRCGIPTVAAAAVTSVLVAVAPFALFSNVSLTNYLMWVRVSADNGLGFWTLRQNIEWALFLIAPLSTTLVAHTHGDRAALRRWLLAGLGIAMALVVLAASKPGAGPYHLLPFIPAILYGVALGYDEAKRSDQYHIVRVGSAAFAIAAALVAFGQITYFFWGATLTRGKELAADIQRFAAAHPAATIAMGYTARDEPFTLPRPILVFRDGSYLLDAPAIQEYQMSGLALPDATVRAITECRVDIWLFAKSAEPFSTPNKYPSSRFVPLFPDVFRSAFFNAYEHVSDTQYFQVWSCRGRDSR
jgi:hypothetical protein